MNLRAFDLFAFIAGGGQASGVVDLADLPRLSAERADDASEPFHWQARGMVRDEAGVIGQPPRRRLFVELDVEGGLWLRCQRCLQRCRQLLTARARLEVVHSEAQADAAPMDDDEADVIVGSRQFDLIAQIEEELLLALPAVPRHAVCPDAPAEAAEAEKKPSPFAALAHLKHLKTRH